MKHIKSFIILLLTSLLAISCMTNRDVFSNNEKTISFLELLKTYNSYKGSVYLGVSGKYSDENTAIEKAIENLAKNIALSYELNVRIDTDIRIVTRYNYERFKQHTIAVYDSTKLQYIIDNMEILQISKGDIETGIYAIGIMPSENIPKIKNTFKYDSKGRPTWIDQEIKIPGYVTAVGKTLEYQYLQDSLEAAVYEGVMSLVSQYNDLVFSASSMTTDKTNNIDNFDLSIYEIDLNKVNGFRVLAYWYDQEPREYYALVAMKY